MGYWHPRGKNRCGKVGQELMMRVFFLAHKKWGSSKRTILAASSWCSFLKKAKMKLKRKGKLRRAREPDRHQGKYGKKSGKIGIKAEKVWERVREVLASEGNK